MHSLFIFSSSSRSSSLVKRAISGSEATVAADIILFRCSCSFSSCSTLNPSSQACNQSFHFFNARRSISTSYSLCSRCMLLSIRQLDNILIVIAIRVECGNRRVLSSCSSSLRSHSFYFSFSIGLLDISNQSHYSHLSIASLFYQYKFYELLHALLLLLASSGK